LKEYKFAPSKSLYIQIKDRIKERILTGKLQKGDKIPSERELCSLFEVSRITVRQAINEAVKEGLLFTVQGKGTFVADYGGDLKIDQGLSQITPFKDAISNAGLSAGTKLVSHQMQPVDFILHKILNIGLEKTVLNLNLLGMANNEPFVFYQSYHEAALGMKLYRNALQKAEKQIVFSTIDLYEEVEFMPSYADQTFEALTADQSQAEILKIQPGSPLFLITSIIYTKKNLPVEYRKAFYRGDKYKFHLKRTL
jgi:GntR family transcriptional regulator